MALKETLPQTMAQLQQSYLKDATAFLNFIEKTKVGKGTILVSMKVSSLYTNIPQEEGTNILCEAYEKLNDHNAPIPTHYLREMLGLIFQENFFQFNGENFSQTKMGGVISQYFHGRN